ncbi:MAG: hypothetical protein JKX99_06370 [Robiginitomaculum sp.]|nr:hypothetical protein [Robiginitomaculum sp.]
MAALISFLGAIGFIAMLMWRLSLGIRAARELGQLAKTVTKRSRKVATTASPQNADPREAAALLMLLVARAGGPLSKRQNDVIINQISRSFAFDQVMAEQFLTHVAKQAHSLTTSKKITQAVEKSSQQIVTSVSAKELLELEEMLMRVAHAKGDPKSAQKAIINQFAIQVGL